MNPSACESFDLNSSSWFWLTCLSWSHLECLYEQWLFDLLLSTSFSWFHCWFDQEYHQLLLAQECRTLPRSTSSEECTFSHHSEGSNLWSLGTSSQFTCTHLQVSIQNRLAHSLISNLSFGSTKVSRTYLFVAKQNIFHEANSCPSVTWEVELACKW